RPPHIGAIARPTVRRRSRWRHAEPSTGPLLLRLRCRSFSFVPFVSRFLPEPRTPVSHPLSVLPNATLLAQLCLFGIMRAGDGTAASAIFCGSGGSAELHESVGAAASCSTGPESADD